MIFKEKYFPCYILLTLCSYHVTCAFQSESTLYICLNFKELLARNRRDIRSLSDCNETRTHNHLVRNRTLNHLTKLVSLAKCLSVRNQTKWLWVRVPLQSLIFYYLTKFLCLVAFTLWNIRQYVYCNCLLTRLWRYKPYLSNQTFFSTWTKNQDQNNLNISRTKRAFKMK